ncbi:hypothetical protein Rmf_37330 [Roseomonas fluvialis]|uniref:Uncharacterized protein n=1 Tax=Roseomonas fluvialis TaxID=1750527 RepID=A0ABN6P7R7_9PROT|nr:hypothetical protein Rmf_37330 [Roseomonas fluvialis]
MVALAVHPARDAHGLAGIGGAERGAGMGAIGVHVLATVTGWEGRPRRGTERGGAVKRGGGKPRRETEPPVSDKWAAGRDLSVSDKFPPVLGGEASAEVGTGRAGCFHEREGIGISS